MRIGACEGQVTKSTCVIRLTTSFWSDLRGVHSKKSLNFLKRKCEGYNVLDEDSANIGPEEVVSKIVNLSVAADGVYEVVTCDETIDWETGLVEDYNYKLIPLKTNP